MAGDWERRAEGDERRRNDEHSRATACGHVKDARRAMGASPAPHRSVQRSVTAARLALRRDRSDSILHRILRLRLEVEDLTEVQTNLRRLHDDLRQASTLLLNRVLKGSGCLEGLARLSQDNTTHRGARDTRGLEEVRFGRRRRNGARERNRLPRRRIIDLGFMVREPRERRKKILNFFEGLLLLPLC